MLPYLEERSLQIWLRLGMGRLSWFILVDPKYHDVYLYVRGKQREILFRDGNMRTEQMEISISWPWKLKWCDYKLRNVRSHRKLEETRNSFSTRISGGNTAMPTPYFWFSDTGFRFLGFRTVGNEFLLFSGTKFVVICYSSHRKIIQYYFLTLLIYPQILWIQIFVSSIIKVVFIFSKNVL